MSPARGKGSVGRNVLVGVTGGIAVYKAVEFVRLLVKEGFNVTVVATEAAERFVMPLTFAAVSQNPVLDDHTSWQSGQGWFEHIDAARRAHILVVAPATANTLAKMASGMADNLLTAVYLAFRGPVVLAPSMNWAMNEHEATRHNVGVLTERGCIVVEGESGELACGEEGSGRMAEPEAILAAVHRAFAGLAGGPLAGRKVVVTAGGTREAIDAVRFLGNRSSGKMGRAVADASYLHGAHVTLVSTMPQEAAPYEVVRVESAAEMGKAVVKMSAAADVLVMAAAVADFRPAKMVKGKIERAETERLTLELERTEDVLAAAARPGLLRVAFAAEAGPQLERARRKRKAKDVEILVFNDILAAGIGIGSDENEITIIGPQGEQHVPRGPKSVCAEAIVLAVERELPRKK
jgi:phosphopantothenoylcysteine decarboxylase / phosphopantothenate---cysteine ligase